MQGGRRIQVRIAPTPAQLESHSSILQPEGETLTAKVVGADRETDLALLKVDRQNLTYLQLGDSDAVR